MSLFRCDFTKNPCGTDTQPAGYWCGCQPCLMWRQIEKLRDALRPFAANFQIGNGYNRDDFQRASEVYGEIVIDQQRTQGNKT